MKSLPPKQLRRLDRALNQMFGGKGFSAPTWPDDFTKEKTPLSRELRLDGGKVIFFSDLGLENLRLMVSSLHEANVFEGLAGYSDVWSACRNVIRDLVSKSLRPDDASELVSLIRQEIERRICDRTFVVQLHGLELEGVDDLALGSMRVVPPNADVITALGVKHTDDVLPRFIEQTKSSLWLIGTTRGTERIAQQRFRDKAHLATGVLAVVAASLYELGARGFRIGVVMSPEEGYGAAQYLSWSEMDKGLAITRQFTRAQRFTIDQQMRTNVEDSVIGRRIFAMLESTSRSDLEEAIVKAVYWYSDAHRDEVTVMRLLKYWSCVEVFFSRSAREITRSVSAGLAATLTHGHLQFIAREEYTSLKKRIAQLYKHRSMAAHGAEHTHTTDKDVSDLSQWVSWLIVSAVVFVLQGATKTSEFVEWSRKVDARHSRSSAWLRTLKGKTLAAIDLARHVTRSIVKRIARTP